MMSVYGGYPLGLFLKKNHKNNKLYLSIVNIYYDHNRGYTVHKTWYRPVSDRQWKPELQINLTQKR